MENQQIEALKYLVIKSRDGDDLIKKILFLLIEKSHGLSKEVSISVRETEGLSREELDKATNHFMNSDSKTTHLGALMRLMGSGLNFSSHYGHYNNEGKVDNTGQFPITEEEGKIPRRYTFWLAKELYGRGGMGDHIPFSIQEIRSIELKSSLYTVQD